MGGWNLRIALLGKPLDEIIEIVHGNGETVISIGDRQGQKKRVVG